MPAQRLISLDVAHQVLTTFGINESTDVYERNLKPGGFKADDLHEILASDSRFIFIIDWRAELPEEMASIAAAVNELAEGLGAQLKVEIDPEENDGWIECGGKRERVKYVP